MLLQIGKTYILNVLVDGHNLTYTAKITALDDIFVSFLDKFDEEYSYNLKSITSIKKVDVHGDSEFD